eukprot:18980-Heterococcus_DN1.PRE.1
MLQRMFNTVTGKRIALFGFAFKKDTGDTRESPAVFVAKALLEEGAKLRVYDPQLSSASAFCFTVHCALRVIVLLTQVSRDQMLTEFEYTCSLNETTMPGMGAMITTMEDAYSACEGAHAIAVLTEWDEFKTLDYAKIYKSMAKPAFVFDGRNIVDSAALREIGFESGLHTKQRAFNQSVHAVGSASRCAHGASSSRVFLKWHIFSVRSVDTALLFCSVRVIGVARILAHVCTLMIRELHAVQHDTRAIDVINTHQDTAPTPITAAEISRTRI